MKRPSTFISRRYPCDRPSVCPYVTSRSSIK